MHAAGCMCAGTLVASPPTPGPGPYFLLMKGEETAVPVLNDTTVLAKVSHALHIVFDLSSAYPASNIQVSLKSSEPVTPAGRKLLGAAPPLAIVLSYNFSIADGLPQTAALEAIMNDTTKNEVLANTLAVLDFVIGEDNQNQVERLPSLPPGMPRQLHMSCGTQNLE